MGHLYLSYVTTSRRVSTTGHQCGLGIPSVDCIPSGMKCDFYQSNHPMLLLSGIGILFFFMNLHVHILHFSKNISILHIPSPFLMGCSDFHGGFL